MKKVLIAGVGLIAILLPILILVPKKQAGNPMPSYPKLSIGNKATITVEIAQTPEKQAKGLSDRANLSSDHGMLFVFPTPGIHSFWMKDMHFPLDFMWIDANDTIVDMHENIPAPLLNTPTSELSTIQPKTAIVKVLEVNSGFINQHQIKMGDIVSLEKK